MSNGGGFSGAFARSFVGTSLDNELVDRGLNSALTGETIGLGSSDISLVGCSMGAARVLFAS